jgi:nitrite reductase/ring-hydroxylating ferredoxin subunit
MSLPATKALAIFPVRVEDDDVYVGLADVAVA